MTERLMSFRRTLLVGAALLCAIALGVGVAVAQAADPRLEQADGALEKAAALLEASQIDPTTDKAEIRFARAVARAVEKIADARAQVAKAQEAAENP